MESTIGRSTNSPRPAETDETTASVQWEIGLVARAWKVHFIVPGAKLASLRIYSWKQSGHGFAGPEAKPDVSSPLKERIKKLVKNLSRSRRYPRWAEPHKVNDFCSTWRGFPFTRRSDRIGRPER